MGSGKGLGTTITSASVFLQICNYLSAVLDLINPSAIISFDNIITSRFQGRKNVSHFTPVN